MSLLAGTIRAIERAKQIFGADNMSTYSHTQGRRPTWLPLGCAGAPAITIPGPRFLRGGDTSPHAARSTFSPHRVRAFPMACGPARPETIDYAAGSARSREACRPHAGGGASAYARTPTSPVPETIAKSVGEPIAAADLAHRRLIAARLASESRSLRRFFCGDDESYKHLRAPRGGVTRCA